MPSCWPPRARRGHAGAGAGGGRQVLGCAQPGAGRERRAGRRAAVRPTAGAGQGQGRAGAATAIRSCSACAPSRRALIPFAAQWNERAARWKWEVNLIGSKQINAFCMPGGKIAFFTGILDQLKLTDDEVAMVMGHEMAHALREHARARTGQERRHRRGAVDRRRSCWAWARPATSPRAPARSCSRSSSAAPTRPTPTWSGSSSPRAPATTRRPRCRCGRRWARPRRTRAG